MTTYSKKLQDPRWQKKRLEILQRDNWTCQSCGDKSETLHVHHKWYEKSVEPWDYKGPCLVTLCNSCHDLEHKVSDDCHKILARSIMCKGLLSQSFIAIAEAIRDMDDKKFSETFGLTL